MLQSCCNLLACIILQHQLNCRLQELKAIFAHEKPDPGCYFTTLSFTCATDEHGAAEADTRSATRMDPHRQRFDQSPLLISHVVRQPGQLNLSQKGEGVLWCSNHNAKVVQGVL